VRKAKVAIDRLVQLQERADELKEQINEYQEALGAI
jgi:hypothetical protein